MEAHPIFELLKRSLYMCAGLWAPSPRPAHRNRLGCFRTGVSRWFLAACLPVACISAAEHHGWVRSGDVPVPGATVTVTQGDKSFVTSTDDSGAYSFANLPDGVWTLRVSMLGFSPVSRDVGVAPEAPSPTWDLTVLGLDAVRQQLAAGTPPAGTQRQRGPRHRRPSLPPRHRLQRKRRQPSLRPAAGPRAAGATGMAGGLRYARACNRAVAFNVWM
jgi:hypothetical protein